MASSFALIGKRFLPARLHGPLEERLRQAEGLLRGSADAAVSRRIALIAFSIRIASAVIAYVTQVLLARWIGEFDYGVFVAIWVTAVILGGMACLGMQTAVIRFISEYQTSGDDAHLRGSIAVSIVWSVLIATALAAIGVAILHQFPGLLQEYWIQPIYLAAICLPMLALGEVQDGIGRAYNWPAMALVPTFILRPLLILAFMFIALAAGFQANATTAMGATILATWLTSLGQSARLWFRLRHEAGTAGRRYDARHWLAVSVPIFFIEGFYNLLTNIDVLLVSRYMNPVDVAIYFAAAKTLALVHFVFFAVKAASAHRFAAYFRSGDPGRYQAFIRETVHWTFWPSAAMAVVMLVLGKYFLMLFGESFVAGEAVIWILTIGIIARASVGPAESVLTMSGEQNACAAAYFATLMIAIMLNMVLIPRYGLAGAALATSTAMIFEAIALFAAARRRLGLHIFILPLAGSTRMSGRASQ